MSDETCSPFPVLSPDGTSLGAASISEPLQSSCKAVDQVDDQHEENEAQRLLNDVDSRPTISTALLRDEPVLSEVLAEGLPENADLRGTSFRRHRQLARLIGIGLLRLLVTGSLIGALYGTFAKYERRGFMVENEKIIYNTLVTGLSMVLGISIASSFKAVAVDVRWWILSQKKRSVDEIDEILACSSLTNVSILAAKSVLRRKPGFLISSTLWVLLNIAAQATVAMLGLTYSLESKSDYSHHVIGNTTFSDMTRFWSPTSEDGSPESTQLAHTFGEFALEYDWSDSIPYYLTSYTYPMYFKEPDSFLYVFEETAANPDSDVGMFYSNRTISVNSTCQSFKATNIQHGTFSYVDRAGQLILEHDGFDALLDNTTTYLTSLAEDTSSICGPRCAHVFAYENNSTTGFYYDCKVMVNNVTNFTVETQQISPSSAKIIAGAIALQDFQGEQGVQQERFSSPSPYGSFLNGNSSLMEEHLNRFAIGVVVTADQVFPFVDSPTVGLLPGEGVYLVINHHKGMWAIFGCLGGAHLILFILGIYLAHKVIVIEDSYLAIALILKPIADGLAGHGRLLDKKKRKELVKLFHVIYGPRDQEKGAARALEISESADSEKWSKKWEGQFDS